MAKKTSKKQEKAPIKIIVTLSNEGRLEVDSNVSILATAGLLSDATSMTMHDIMKQSQAEKVQPVIESDGIN